MDVIQIFAGCHTTITDNEQNVTGKMKFVMDVWRILAGCHTTITDNEQNVTDKMKSVMDVWRFVLQALWINCNS
jgi:hypothetical protein